MTPPEYFPENQPVAALLVPDILALLDESPTAVAAGTEDLPLIPLRAEAGGR